MLQVRDIGSWKDIGAAVLISAIFSQFGMLIFFMTLPLYVLSARRNSRVVMTAALSVLVINLLIDVWNMRAVTDTGLKWAVIVLDMMIPVLLTLGLFFVINIFPGMTGKRKLYKLFAATVFSIVISLPVFFLLKNNELFISAIEEQFTAMGSMFFNSENRNFETELMQTYFDGETFLEYLKGFYLRSIVFIYFALLAGLTRMGDVLLARFSRRKLLNIRDFKLPEFLLWPFLISVALLAVEVFELFSFSYFSPVIWNVGFILLLLYGLQGLAIMRSLYVRIRIPPGLQLMTEFIFILLLFMPGVNYIVIIGIPLLGVSETWINLRKPMKEY